MSAKMISEQDAIASTVMANGTSPSASRSSVSFRVLRGFFTQFVLIHHANGVCVAGVYRICHQANKKTGL